MKAYPHAEPWMHIHYSKQPQKVPRARTKFKKQDGSKTQEQYSSTEENADIRVRIRLNPAVIAIEPTAKPVHVRNVQVATKQDR